MEGPYYVIIDSTLSKPNVPWLTLDEPSISSKSILSSLSANELSLSYVISREQSTSLF